MPSYAEAEATEEEETPELDTQTLTLEGMPPRPPTLQELFTQDVELQARSTAYYKERQRLEAIWEKDIAGPIDAETERIDVEREALQAQYVKTVKPRFKIGDLLGVPNRTFRRGVGKTDTKFLVVTCINADIRNGATPDIEYQCIVVPKSGKITRPYHRLYHEHDGLFMIPDNDPIMRKYLRAQMKARLSGEQL